MPRRSFVMKINKELVSYSPDCFREAVKKRGGHLPVAVDDIIGNLIGAIVQNREIREKWNSPSTRFDVQREVSEYRDLLIENLSGRENIKIVKDEISKLDDKETSYLRTMYPECVL